MTSVKGGPDLTGSHVLSRANQITIICEHMGCSVHVWLEGNYNRSCCDPPPAIYQNLGGGGGQWVGGSIRGSAGGGVPNVGACARPTTTTCILPRGTCVWGFGGMEGCM